MTDKIITIEISGEGAVIDAALDAFVKQNGWTEEVNGEPNPVTKMDKAEAVLKSFFGQTVTAYQVNEAARVARELAAEESAAALDLTTMTVTVA